MRRVILFHLPFLHSIAFVVLILLGAGICFSQSDIKGMLTTSIGTGVSKPWGKYGKTDSFDEESGFAETTLQYNLNLIYMISERVGAHARVVMVNHPVDEDEFRLALEDVTFAGFQNPDFSLSADPWKSFYYLLGPVFTIHGQTAYFDFKPMFGLARVNSPFLEVALREGDDQLLINQQNRQSSSFMYGLGIGSRIALGEKLMLVTDIEMLYSALKFGDEGVFFPTMSVVEQSFEQPISVYNISLGLGLKL